MRDIFINYSISKIKKQYSNYDDDKIAEIKYGLEGLYILITKSIIIFGIAFILNIVKELLLLLLFFNFLRFTGFGLHAKSSLKCLGSSTLVFIGIAIVSKYFIISIPIKLVVSLFCVANFLIFAPADTEKRPLINKRKRYIYKFVTTAISIIYTILLLLIKTNFITNIIMFSMVIEGVLINPLSYRLLGLRYDNYKYYNH